MDKTRYIYEIISSSKYNIYKSSKEYIYQGEKELFKNLYIYNKWDWDKTYPVIRIDFSVDIIKQKKDFIHY